MPIAKINKTFVDQTPFTDKGQTLYCDQELAGFYLVVGKRAKTYIVQKDIKGHSVRCTIGRHGHFTHDRNSRPTTWVTPPLDEARKVWDQKQFPASWNNETAWLSVSISPGDPPF